MIDMVSLREFEYGRGRVDCLQHVDRETVILQLQWFSPVPEGYQMVDLLVVTIFVERGIESNSAQLQDV